MKVLAATSLAVSLAPAALAQQFSAQSQNAEQTMSRLMSMKIADHQKMRDAGLMGKGRWASFAAPSPCVDGVSNGTFQCNNVDLYAFASHSDLGSEAAEGNDVWGWTSGSGREFAAVGQVDGTAFVEINTSTGEIQYIGRLPTQSTPTVWRDIKVINGFAYIGSEAPNHGIQIFDMRKLEQAKSRDQPIASPIVYGTQDLTALFSGVGSTHNLVANEATDMIYGVGGQQGPNSRNSSCAAGLFMIDVSDPANPVSPGCVPDDGYVHDAQCVIYTGPDTAYAGQEICFGFNEDTLTIYDVTDKSAPVVVSVTPYQGAAYSHQGWLVDTTNMRYLLLDDELDEMDGTGQGEDPERTTTYIWDVGSLKAPVQTGFYKSPVRSIDHNQYVINGISYQSNYNSGLRIVDVSSVADDPTGAGFREVGFFDFHPEDDDAEGGGIVEFSGTWSVYPYFQSGYIVVNSIERGLFSVKFTG